MTFYYGNLNHVFLLKTLVALLTELSKGENQTKNFRVQVSMCSRRHEIQSSTEAIW